MILHAILSNLNGCEPNLKKHIERSLCVDSFCVGSFRPSEVVLGDRFILIEGFGELECIEIPNVHIQHSVNVRFTGKTVNYRTVVNDVGESYEKGDALMEVEFYYDGIEEGSIRCLEGSIRFGNPISGGNMNLISELDGIVKYGNSKIFVEGKDGTIKEYSIPRGARIVVPEGTQVRAGEPLTQEAI